MAEISKRRLLWLGVVTTVLILAMAGWSQLHLRSIRAKLDALAVESEELSQKNEALLRERSREMHERDEIRAAGDAVDLEARRPDLATTGIIYLDQKRGRALFVMEHGQPGGRYQLWLRGSHGEHSAATFELDTSGTMQLLLRDLPNNIEGAFVTTDDTPDLVLMESAFQE